MRLNGGRFTQISAFSARALTVDDPNPPQVHSNCTLTPPDFTPTPLQLHSKPPLQLHQPPQLPQFHPTHTPLPPPPSDLTGPGRSHGGSCRSTRSCLNLCGSDGWTWNMGNQSPFRAASNCTSVGKPQKPGVSPYLEKGSNTMLGSYSGADSWNCDSYELECQLPCLA